MSRSRIPEVPAAALKRHAAPEGVERVWRRIDLDIRRMPRTRRSSLVWLPTSAAVIFGLGVLVGARFVHPPVELAAVAEPRTLSATPGAAPAVGREAPRLANADRAPRKLRGNPRALSAVVAAEEAEEYPETYGEPVPLVVVEPVALSGPAEWERLAETGDFRAAKLALDREGGFDMVSGSASASQLMSLADIARAAGSREQALLALRRVLLAYVSAPEAPIAAWTLGNLLEQSGDKLGAAEAYATYRRLSPTGDFAEDAAARQVDVALSEGNLELGSRAVDEYAQNFPKGRRLAELRGRLARLAGAAEPSAPAIAEPDDEEEVADPDVPTLPGTAAPARER